MRLNAGFIPIQKRKKQDEAEQKKLREKLDVDDGKNIIIVEKENLLEKGLRAIANLALFSFAFLGLFALAFPEAREIIIAKLIESILAIGG